MKQVSRPYHHGDLRRALLAAALGIVRAEGTAALTLRGVARAAGVSHQAPYHHFADRAALVAAVAQEGFERLQAELESVTAAGDPVTQFRESGIAYVIFAVKQPELFRVMFGPELADRSLHPDLDRAAQRAFERLLAPASALLDSANSSGEGLKATLWSAMHGLAMLLIDGQLAGAHGKARRLPSAAANKAAARHLALAVTERLWFGLQPLLTHNGARRNEPGGHP